MLIPKLRKFSGVLFSRSALLLLASACFSVLNPLPAAAETITPYQSVEQALKHSPQLQALTHSQQAAEFDLKQSRGRYLPSVDLMLGYGAEQHSDSATRRAGADPADTDWDSRGDASLQLTQNIYDGGETSQQVVIQKSLLDSAGFQLRSTAQAVALNALAAHLDVFRQRELVALAEKNLAVHADIHRSLAERAQAGAGSIADVSQAQARMARAQSTLYLSQSDLRKALANYYRLVGVTPDPEELTYAGVPETVPPSLDLALEQMAEGNPELRIFEAAIVEAEARVALARSTYKPKLDVQLSSRYNDQLEGDQSWQNTNDAMLNLRWNLFNGGQDKAGANAAAARKFQSRSARDDKLFELQEATTAAWANYQSLQGQKVAYRDAVGYSQKTFDAYLHQFSVSQRSLLDVLSAENDYFQSASQLISVTVNETLAAYQLLALVGDLQVPRCAGVREYPEEISLLKQALVLPSMAPALASERQNEPPAVEAAQLAVVPPAPAREPLPQSAPAPAPEPIFTPVARVAAQPSAVPRPEPEWVPFFAVEIGPCINAEEAALAREVLNDLGLAFNQNPGTGQVRMVRLLEGIYPAAEAHERLAEIQKSVASAYLLPETDQQLGVYLGSFHEPGRAARFAEKLDNAGIKTQLVTTEIQLSGDVLVAQKTDSKTAQALLASIGKLGLSAYATMIE